MTHLSSDFLWDEGEYEARKAGIWQEGTKIPINKSTTIRSTAWFYWTIAEHHSARPPFWLC